MLVVSWNRFLCKFADWFAQSRWSNTWPCDATVAPTYVRFVVCIQLTTVVVSCSRWSRAWLPIWNFWSQVLKFRLFLTHLFLLIKKSQSKPGCLFYFFQYERLGSGNTLSEPHIHYKSLLTRVYDHAGCKEYCKDFTVALKMLDVLSMKQMYDSVFTGQVNASKNCNYIISMFLTSFNIYFCLVMHVSLCV